MAALVPLPTRQARALLLIATALCIPGAYASGFRLPELSVAGIGTSNALAANPEDLGALAYNPAAMAFHSGFNIVVGTGAIVPDNSVTTATGKHDSDTDTPFYLPMVYLMGQIGPQWSWGLNISSPFGLETNWPDETFPIFGMGPIPDSIEPSRSKLELVNINPNISYRFSPNTSVAVGLDYYAAKQTRLDAQGVKMSGDGDGTGWNAALMHRAGDWTVGLSYHSSAKLSIDGTVGAGPLSSPAKTELSLPATWQFGVSVKVTPSLLLEFDLDLTQWSGFKSIIIPHGLAPVVPSPISSANNWKDAMAYRFGGTYQFAPGTKLRFGYSYDETGQGDDHFNARIPDANRHLFGIGIAQKFGSWNVDLGYMYILFADRTITASAPFGTYGSDANGTSAFNGKYQGDAHLLGAGISTRF